MPADSQYGGVRLYDRIGRGSGIVKPDRTGDEISRGRRSVLGPGGRKPGEDGGGNQNPRARQSHGGARGHPFRICRSRPDRGSGQLRRRVDRADVVFLSSGHAAGREVSGIQTLDDRHRRFDSCHQSRDRRSTLAMVKEDAVDVTSNAWSIGRVLEDDVSPPCAEFERRRPVCPGGGRPPPGIAADLGRHGGRDLVDAGCSTSD